MTIKSLAAFCAALLIALYSTCGFAQNGFRSEADLLRQASKHYEAAEYAKALPLYSQAVSNHPENSEYNYRLGVCMVEAGKQKEDAVRFLEMAAKSDQINPDVNYYLGVALNHASRFDESVVALEKFRRSGVRKEKVKAADEYIRYGRNALEAQSDLSADRNDVIGKSETDVSGLAGMYKFETDAGRIMKVPAELADKNCKGEMSCDYFFLSKGGTTLVLARNMGKGRGYDLFRMTRQRNGKWSEPIDFGPTVNTSADEVYGTLTPDGKTLFFSSNGPTSTGGYDLFKSVMNPGGNTWSAPSSIGFPVNSPGNDFYYVISDDGTRAFFASDRESAAGRFHVYEAAVTRDTRRFFAIEGKFTCPQCIDQTSASISVIDPETMGAVAHVRSRPGTDEYKLKLYVPSDFIYQVEADGFSFAQQVVNLEERGRGTVFQEIILRRDDSGSEKLVIVNRYDESQEPLTIPVQAAMEVQAKEEPAAPVANETTAVAVTPENTEIPEAKAAEVPVVAAPVVEQPVAEAKKPEATELKTVQPVQETQIAAQEAKIQAIANDQPSTKEPVRVAPEPQITDKQEVVSPTAEVQPASMGVPPIFKVQLGAYYSVSEKDLRKRMAGKVPADAEYIRNDKGYIQLISGNMPDYESAKNLKEQFIAAGFEGAFVVVFAGERQAVLAEYVKSEPVQP